MCFSFLKDFENVLGRYKKNTAVAYWDASNTYTTLSYEKVAEISKSIFEVIKDTIKEKYICIGLFMDHNYLIPSLIISLQKFHLSFIFLDPYVPEDTNFQIIQKLNTKWIFSNDEEKSNEFLSKHASTEGLEIANQSSLKLWKINSSNLEIINSFKEICYVICTSGTTGAPKIVKVPEECIKSNIVNLRQKFNMTSTDVIYFGTPLTFDPSMVELFLALTTGASLLIPPPKIKNNSARLLSILFPNDNSHHRGVTVLQTVPSLFLRWNQNEIEFILQNCRILALGGEKFPASILKLKKSNHRVRIFNLYGITEVSCWASAHEVTEMEEEEISLGEALGVNETILEVRDAKSGLKIVQGEGELFIGSFTRICYIDEENDLTVIKPVFRSTGDLVRLTNGALFYLCRKGNVIKRLGHRLNLLDVEKSVLELTLLPNACIWIENKSKLILFVVIAEYNSVTKIKIVDKIQVKLLHGLPKYAFPDRIEIVPNLPLTRHGKVNKTALEFIYNHSVRNDFNVPIDVFKFLCCKYLGLGLEEIETYSERRFFEIGGNSFSAIQFLSEFGELIDIEHSNNLTILLYEQTLGECCNFLLNSDFTVKKPKHPHTRKIFNNNKIRIVEQVSPQTNSNIIKIKIAWKYNLHACVDSSPKIIQTRSSTLIAVGSFAHIFAIIDSATGCCIAETILPDTIEGASCPSPLNSHVYTGCYDGTMYCIDYASGKIIWAYPTNDRIKSTPCLCLQSQAIVFGSYDKHIHCVNLDGILKWKTFVDESVSSNPICYECKIYIATIFGTCLCLSEDRGVILWKIKLDVVMFGSPCVDESNGNVIWPDVNGKLHFLACESGQKKWNFKVNGGVYSSLTRYKDHIIFGCHDHNVYCTKITENDCNLIYKVELGSAINSSPQIMEYKGTTYIVAAANQGIVYIIEFTTGQVVETVNLQGEIFSTPVIKNERIYIGCRDNNLYCLSD